MFAIFIVFHRVDFFWGGGGKCVLLTFAGVMYY